jgi:hypothetical protein
MTMMGFIRNKIQDDLQYTRTGQFFFLICIQCRVHIDDLLLGLEIVQLFHGLNKYAESTIVLHPSRKKDGAGSRTVCPSPLTIELELVYSF